MQSDGQLAGMRATTKVAPVSSIAPDPTGQTTGVSVAVTVSPDANDSAFS
jgi:hypothetical protein